MDRETDIVLDTEVKWWVEHLHDKRWNGKPYREMSTLHLRNCAALIKERVRKRTADFIRQNPFRDSTQIDELNFKDEIIADEMNHYANWRERKK